MSNWTLFSNHGHVLICLVRDSEARLRDVAADVGITERAVQKIVRDLQDGGMVSVTKIGRRNRYRIHRKISLRHDLEANCTLKDLISIVSKSPGTRRSVHGGLEESAKRQPRKPEHLKSIGEPPSIPASKKETVKPKPARPEPKKPVSGKAESGKSRPEESRERQQGSLF